MRKQSPIISKSSECQYQPPPGSHLQEGFSPEGDSASAGDISQSLQVFCHNGRGLYWHPVLLTIPQGTGQPAPDHRGSGPNVKSLEVERL